MKNELPRKWRPFELNGTPKMYDDNGNYCVGTIATHVRELIKKQNALIDYVAELGEKYSELKDYYFLLRKQWVPADWNAEPPKPQAAEPPKYREGCPVTHAFMCESCDVADKCEWWESQAIQHHADCTGKCSDLNLCKDKHIDPDEWWKLHDRIDTKSTHLSTSVEESEPEPVICKPPRSYCQMCNNPLHTCFNCADNISTPLTTGCRKNMRMGVAFCKGWVSCGKSEYCPFCGKKLKSANSDTPFSKPD